MGIKRATNSEGVEALHEAAYQQPGRRSVSGWLGQLEYTAWENQILTCSCIEISTSSAFGRVVKASAC